MCGRTRCTLAPEATCQACEKALSRRVQPDAEDAFHPSENISPGNTVPVIRNRNTCDGAVPVSDASTADLVLTGMRWGLVPSFTKQGTRPNFFRMFNARSETVPSKAIFSRLLKHRRCLVAVEGFYEWRQEHKIKQPYYVHLTDEPILVFAGLYDTWHDGDAVLHTCTILTTDSSKKLAWLHDRMPAVLPTPEARTRWLTASSEDLAGLLRPYGGDNLAWHKVTPAMNKPQYKEHDCAAPVAQKGLGSFFGSRGASREAKDATPTPNTDEQPTAMSVPAPLDAHVKVEVQRTGGCELDSGESGPKAAHAGAEPATTVSVSACEGSPPQQTACGVPGARQTDLRVDSQESKGLDRSDLHRSGRKDRADARTVGAAPRRAGPPHTMGPARKRPKGVASSNNGQTSLTRFFGSK